MGGNIFVFDFVNGAFSPKTSISSKNFYKVYNNFVVGAHGLVARTQPSQGWGRSSILLGPIGILFPILYL